MRALTRKLLRDTVRARGQVITTSLVVAGGICAFVGMMGTYDSTRRAQVAYYERLGMPDLFVSARRVPDAEEARLRELDDVAQVSTRIAIDGRLDMPGLPEPALARFVSLPREGEVGLPAVHLHAGRLPERTREREVLVLQGFAEEHALHPGDTLEAIVDGRRLDLEVTGVALSPEYVIAISASGIYDARRFSVVWMRREDLAAALDMEGAFNDVTIRGRPGADLVELGAEVDRVLERWGGFGAYPRKNQPSHRALDGELAALRGITVQVPMIFLGVGAFLLNVILGRMIRMQREQIAALKALGYTRREIAFHYYGFAGVIVLAGSVLGVALGWWFGSWFTHMYSGFFRLPSLGMELRPSLVFTAIGVSALAAFGGAWRAVRGAARLPPAEATRPPAPAAYRRGLLSVLGVPRLLTHTGRMVVRELERRPGRALASTLAISLGVALLIVGRFRFDGMDWYVRNELERGMPADLLVILAKPVDDAVVEEIAGLPGVLRAEPARSVPVRLRLGPRDRLVSLSVVPGDGELKRIVRLDGKLASVPPTGVALGRATADALQARVGDRILVERLEGDRRTVDVRVTSIVEDLAGLSAYMRADPLHRVFREQPATNAVLVQVDLARQDELEEALRASPRVATTVSRQRIVDTFRASTADYAGVVTMVIVLFGTVLAVGVVYNNARVVLSERGRDLATLRVLGFTRREVSSILLGELAVQLLVAIPLGMAIGNLMCLGLVASFDEEMFRIPLVIYPLSYTFSVITVIGAGVLSALLSRRQLDHLDLVGALKARD